MSRTFKALVVSAEELSDSDDFTQIVTVVDGVAWELDSSLSALRKDAAGYRISNAANRTGGQNYIKGELETAYGRAKELMEACAPLRDLAARWAAEDAAAASHGSGVYEAASTGDPGHAARFEIKV